MATKVIEGSAAKALGREEKWRLLSPFLKRYGSESLAYSTLQEGMEYFVTEDGYIAYTTVYHPVFARKTKKMALSDPLCAPDKRERLVKQFLERNPHAAFIVISEDFGAALRGMGFKVNCVGYEPELAIQTYNTKGNWKELDLIKRARNEAKREGITIREETSQSLDRKEIGELSARWISTKKVNDREIWIYARRPVLEHEEDVRKFVAYEKEGHVVGFIFYDPMYREGKVYGYAACIARSDEKRYGRLAT